MSETPYDPSVEELDENQVTIHEDAPEFDTPPWQNTVDGKQDDFDGDDDPAKDSSPAAPQEGGTNA